MPIADYDLSTVRWTNGYPEWIVENDWLGEPGARMQFRLEFSGPGRSPTLMIDLLSERTPAGFRERLSAAWMWLRHGRRMYLEYLGLEQATVAGLAARLAEVAERMVGRE